MESFILSLTIKPSSICMVSPPAAIIPAKGLIRPKSNAIAATICRIPVIFRCTSLNLKR